MLSILDIQKKLVADDDSRIEYRPKWILDTAGGTVDVLDSNNGEAILAIVLDKATNDRLAVHAGRLAYVFRDLSKEENDARWHDHQEPIVDIEALADGYELQPGETVVIASSEFVSLPNDIAAIVVPRVGNHLTGIDLAVTFIDAGWEGVLTLQVTNVDTHPRILRHGLELARTFFFELSNPVADAQNECRRGSHHYGLDWETILKDGGNPFARVIHPSRKMRGRGEESTQGPVSAATSERKKESIKESALKFFKLETAHPAFVWAVAIMALGPLSVLGWLSLRIENVGNALSAANRLSTVETAVQELPAIRTGLPIIVSGSVIVEAGSVDGRSQPIRFPKERQMSSDNPPILVLPSDALAARGTIRAVDWDILQRPDGSQYVEVTIEINDATVSAREFDFDIIFF